MCIRDRDGACERIASWAKLQDKVSGKEFFALNTHLDHVGVAARREGISPVSYTHLESIERF